MNNKNRKIEIYADGATTEEINKLKILSIDGYTFNPSLFRKNKADDYIGHSKKILALIPNKPVSLEVIADTNDEMIEQALKLNKLASNVFVKVPITNTKGISTLPVLDRLCKENIKMNITAIFTIDQVREILETIKETNSIISVFSGRLFDIGLDAVKLTKEISEFTHANSNCKVLWASTRMVYDYINAQNAGCDIITMSYEFITKMDLFNKSPEEYSLQTVQTFYKDAIDAKYSF